MKKEFENIKRDFNLIYKIRMDRLDDNELKNIFNNLSSIWREIENEFYYNINLSLDRLSYNNIKDIYEMIYHINLMIENEDNDYDYSDLSSNIDEMINELKKYIELLEKYL